MTAADGNALDATAAGDGLIRLVRFYYLATPAFALLDILGGVNLRVPGLGTGWMRYVYYVICFGFGLLAARRPRVAPLVGLCESGLNLIMLIFGMMLPLIEGMRTGLGDDVMKRLIEGPFSWRGIAGFLMLAGICGASLLRWNYVIVTKAAREDLRRRRERWDRD